LHPGRDVGVVVQSRHNDVVTGVLCGAGLSILNALAGYLALEYAFDKSYSTFVKFVLGGMGLRLMFLLGVLVVLIVLAHVHAVALTVSTVSLYLVFLILEIFLSSLSVYELFKQSQITETFNVIVFSILFE